MAEGSIAGAAGENDEASGAKVALLTNFIPPYRVPVLRGLAERVGGLRVLVSTPMEANRSWAPAWEGLDVVVQRTLSIPRSIHHPGGFREKLPLHVPIDTRRQLRAYDPALVISGEFGARTLASAGWCRATGRPLVVWATLSERTEAAYGGVRGRLRKAILRQTARVIVNGESGARYVRSLGYPDERIDRIPQASPAGVGADRVPAPRAEPLGEGSLRLLYVGQLTERKGLRGLLAELSAWTRREGVDAELVLVGEGPQAAELREVALSIEGPLRVRFAGEVAFDALAERYRAADLLVLPTLADEWGLVVNEAMAAGLPVLGSVYSQAVTELVEDGRTGWWYDPERPGSLATKLDEIRRLGRDGIRCRGEAARTRVARLTPESMASDLYRTIAHVLAERRHRP